MVVNGYREIESRLSVGLYGSGQRRPSEQRSRLGPLPGGVPGLHALAVLLQYCKERTLEP
jgi:hypothetical protein